MCSSRLHGRDARPEELLTPRRWMTVLVNGPLAETEIDRSPDGTGRTGDPRDSETHAIDLDRGVLFEPHWAAAERTWIGHGAHVDNGWGVDHERSLWRAARREAGEPVEIACEFLM